VSGLRSFCRGAERQSHTSTRSGTCDFEMHIIVQNVKAGFFEAVQNARAGFFEGDVHGCGPQFQ
jgi:hypothetical protein